MTDTHRVAERFNAAFARLDASLFDALYAADAVIWHSSDQVEVPRSAAIAGVTRFFNLFKTLSILEVKCQITETGYVQQHSLSGIFKDGVPLQPVPICLVVTVRDDQITRLEEYIDVRALAHPAA